jgi:hypothetical protein
MTQESAKLQEQERQRVRIQEKSVMKEIERSLGVINSPRSPRSRADVKAADLEIGAASNASTVCSPIAHSACTTLPSSATA